MPQQSFVLTAAFSTLGSLQTFAATGTDDCNADQADIGLSIVNGCFQKPGVREREV